MSPVDDTQDYDYYHENKGTGRVWSLTDDVCLVKSQKVNERVHFTECVKVILTHTEDTSTMSPGDNTQDYDYYHENKGTGRVWSFTDGVCGVKSQKAIECVNFTECVKLSSSPTQN